MQQAASTTTPPSPGRRQGLRVLSYSEVSRALDCQAQWDFSYGGHLAGTSLKPKAVAPMLSGGRAWGRAVAELHSTGSIGAATAALENALEDDADRMREYGVYDPAAHLEMHNRLDVMIGHYRDTADVFPAHTLEHKLLVPIPARVGPRSSSRYRLECYIDAIRDDEAGRTWLVEFKLRNRLTDARMIALSRQIRWYAWAYWRATGRRIAGVLTVERWNEVPKPPRIVRAKRKAEGIDGMVPSHAKDQLTTASAYAATCEEYGVDVDPDTYAALDARRWHQAVPVMFRDGEMDEVGHELIAAGRMIRDLDNGDAFPMRNAKPQRCNYCDFRDVCDDPASSVVDAMFERTVPKRLRSNDDNPPKEAMHDHQAADPVPNF